MKRERYTLLLVLVFISGMTSLAVEMCASRLLAPFFGTSLIVWANLIGMVLLYLTIGYFLGGRLADRFPQEKALYQLTAWAAFAIGLIPFISPPILRWSLKGFSTLSAAILASSLFGVVLLFSVPMTLLGCVSPFAIRLAVRDVSRAGNVAGGLYALSTLGSLVGTFTPVLILIPNIGTKRTFLFFSIVLLVVSLLGLMRTAGHLAWAYLLLLIALVALSLLIPGGVIKPARGAIFETESAYNYIRVVERGDWRYLELNEELAAHSVYNPERLLTYNIWDYFLVAPFFNPDQREEDVKSMALIGLAAGTVARQYSAAYGPIPIDGVEIDPEIIEVGRRYFDMNQPNLRAIAQDGRYFLLSSERRYDVIGVDAYQPPYIPFHLTTKEFFSEIKAHLNERGVVAINAGRTAEDYSLVRALASTMKQVFPSVHVIDMPNEGRTLANSLVVGTVEPTKLENFPANMERMTNPLILEVARMAVGHLSEFKDSGFAFTDDKAPIEQLVHGMILKYVMSEAR